MRYIELCCGSSAIALYQIGAKKSLMPYQGSKWRFRRQIVKCFGNPNISSIELYDSGPWGRVMPIIFNKKLRKKLIEKLEIQSKSDPFELYNKLHKNIVPINDCDFAAQFLFLQRLSYNGKAVAVRDGKWASPGFNRVHAYGAEPRPNFGRVYPMFPALIKNLKSYNLKNVSFKGGQINAPSPDGNSSNSIVYIDPPYRKSTRYPNGDMSREEVVGLANEWYNSGASVFVSESEPIDDLVSSGWSVKNISLSANGNSSFKSKKTEFLTYIKGNK